MAAIALTTMTTWLVNHGRAAYAWFTALPAAFVLVTTISAAVLSTINVFWPMAHHTGTEAQGWVEIMLMSLFVFESAIIIVSTTARCIQTLRGTPPPSAESSAIDGGRISPSPPLPIAVAEHQVVARKGAARYTNAKHETSSSNFLSTRGGKLSAMQPTPFEAQSEPTAPGHQLNGYS
jgi:hypothetical protein